MERVFCKSSDQSDNLIFLVFLSWKKNINEMVYDVWYYHWLQKNYANVLL